MFRGSNTEEGKFYHKNWFGNEPHQRIDSDKRISAILNNYNVVNKTVLDLGCNIGWFSFAVNKFGAKTTSIDYDTDAIKFAKKMQKEHNIKNIEFLNKEINVKELKKIGKIDCTFALAILSWIMHQTSREEMEKIIDWMAKNSQVNFIEIQYRGEPGELPWITNDDECEAYLRKWFKYVYKVIKVSGWGPRTVWKCGNETGEWRKIYSNAKTTCYISDNGFFKKVKENKNVSYDNEIKYLKRVEGEIYFPTVLEYTDNMLLLSGLNAVNLETLIHKHNASPDIKGFGRSMFHLIGCLEDHNIKHQDINFENILISNVGTIFLVDFECATDLDGELKNPIITDKNKVNNTVMAKRVLNELVRAIEFFTKTEEND